MGLRGYTRLTLGPTDRRAGDRPRVGANIVKGLRFMVEPPEGHSRKSTLRMRPPIGADGRRPGGAANLVPGPGLQPLICLVS